MDKKSEVLTIIEDEASKRSILVLPGLVFENLNSLETLNLNHNKLQHVPEEVVEPIIDTVTRFDLSENALVCTCDLAWYLTWYKKVKGTLEEKEEKDSMRKTMCYLESGQREYNLRALPLKKLQCVGKNMEQISSASRHTGLISSSVYWLGIGSIFLISNIAAL